MPTWCLNWSQASLPRRTLHGLHLQHPRVHRRRPRPATQDHTGLPSRRHARRSTSSQGHRRPALAETHGAKPPSNQARARERPHATDPGSLCAAWVRRAVAISRTDVTGTTPNNGASPRCQQDGHRRFLAIRLNDAVLLWTTVPTGRRRRWSSYRFTAAPGQLRQLGVRRVPGKIRDEIDQARPPAWPHVEDQRQGCPARVAISLPGIRRADGYCRPRRRRGGRGPRRERQMSGMSRWCHDPGS